MAESVSRILIKSSNVKPTPNTGDLQRAELAYSYASDKLFIGDSAGQDSLVIGGQAFLKLFKDVLDEDGNVNLGIVFPENVIVAGANNTIDSLDIDSLKVKGKDLINAATNELVTDNTLSNVADTKLISSKAIKDYVDNRTDRFLNNFNESSVVNAQLLVANNNVFENKTITGALELHANGFTSIRDGFIQNQMLNSPAIRIGTQEIKLGESALIHLNLDTSGILDINRGGTGRHDIEKDYILLGNGTNSVHTTNDFYFDTSSNTNLLYANANASITMNVDIGETLQVADSLNVSTNQLQFRDFFQILTVGGGNSYDSTIVTYDTISEYFSFSSGTVLNVSNAGLVNILSPTLFFGSEVTTSANTVTNIHGLLNVYSNTEFSGNTLTISSTTDTVINGEVTLNNNVFVNGNTFNISSTTTSTFYGPLHSLTSANLYNVNIDGIALNVSNNTTTTIQGDVYLSGSSLNISESVYSEIYGNVYYYSTLINTSATTTATFDGPVIINGSLDVTGDVVFKGNTTYTGEYFTVSNNTTVDVSGNVTLFGDELSVSSNTTFNDRVTINNNVDVYAPFRVFDNAEIKGDLVVENDLYVYGNSVQILTETLTVEDNIILLGANNITDVVDLGFAGRYNESGNTVYAGIFRDATDNKFYVFENYPTEPPITSMVGYDKNTMLATLYADIEANTLIAYTGTLDDVIITNSQLNDSTANIFTSNSIVANTYSGIYLDMLENVNATAAVNEILTAYGNGVFYFANTANLASITTPSITTNDNLDITSLDGDINISIGNSGTNINLTTGTDGYINLTADGEIILDAPSGGNVVLKAPGGGIFFRGHVSPETTGWNLGTNSKPWNVFYVNDIQSTGTSTLQNLIVTNSTLENITANNITANTYSGIYLDMLENVNATATVGQTLTAYGNGEFYFSDSLSVNALTSFENTLENISANNIAANNINVSNQLISLNNILENVTANNITANTYSGIYLDMLENVNATANIDQVLTSNGAGGFYFANAATELKELTDVNSTASNNQVLTADGLGNFYFANNIHTTTFASLVDVNTNSSADEILTSYGNGVFYFSNTLTNVQINSSDADNLIANNSTLENSKAIEEFLIEGVSTSAGKLVLNCEINTHGQTIIAQPHSAGVTNILTLPAGGNQEIVGTTATQTLTNKTLTSAIINTSQIYDGVANNLVSNNATINDSTLNNVLITSGIANNTTLNNPTLNNAEFTEEILVLGVSGTSGKLILNCEINTHGQTIIAQPHSAGVTNILTLPAGSNQEIVGTSATQTLTNKTLTSPAINSATISSSTINSSTINNSTAINLTSNNATLNDPTLNSPLINNAEFTEELLVLGVTGTSGKLILNCEVNTHGQTIIAQPHSAGVTNILTLPAGGNQELVGTTATQTLTNKTLTSPVLNTAQINNSIADGLTSNNATINTSEINDSTYNNVTIVNGTANNLTLNDATLNSNTTFNGYVTINNTLEVANDLHVDGDLFVNGNTITLDAQTLTVEDNIVVLGSNNVSDITDLGFAFKYNDGSNDAYAGLFRDATDEKFYLFKDFLADPPVTTMTGFNTSTMLATLFGNFEANNIQAMSGTLEDVVANNSIIQNSTITDTIIDCGTF